MQRYKFQGFLTVDPPGQGQDTGGPGGSPAPRPVLPEAGILHRMVIYGEHCETHATKIFSGLVSASADGATVQDDSHLIVTIALSGDGLASYFAPGAGFTLWQGRDIGHGVVTRRLFV